MRSNAPRSYNEKRETAKAIILVHDPKFGKCILLHKEFNGRYGLPGGGIERGETGSQALKRELTEELFKNLSGNDNVAKIKKQKLLENFETNRHFVHLFAVALENRYLKLSGEGTGIGLYPLEDKYEKERKAIETVMEYNAKKAVRDFKEKHDWKSYENSGLRHWEEVGLMDSFMEELDKLKKQIKK